MDKYTDVSFTSLPDDKECVFNATQISKIINEIPSTIRVWANQYQDYLYIKKINGRFVYTKRSVEQFKFIKDLRDRGFPHAEIENIIKKQGFTSNIDSEITDVSNPIGFQALASSLSLENKKTLEQFLMALQEQHRINNEKLVEDIKKEVSITVEETIDDKIKGLSEQNQYLKDKLDAIERDNKLISDLQQRLIDRQEKAKENKGFWKRLFRK